MRCSFCDDTGKYKKPNDEEKYDKLFDYYADKAYFISMGEAREKALADVGYTWVDCPFCKKSTAEFNEGRAAEKVYVYAIDMDICPDNDMVLTRHQCSGCPHYRGFSLENALPCIKCAYYAQFEQDPPTE